MFTAITATISLYGKARQAARGAALLRRDVRPCLCCGVQQVSYHVTCLSCPFLSCLVLSCLVLSCPVLSILSLSSRAEQSIAFDICQGEQLYPYSRYVRNQTAVLCHVNLVRPHVHLEPLPYFKAIGSVLGGEGGVLISLVLR